MNVFRFLKLKKPIKKCAHLLIQFRFLFLPLKWPQPTTK